MESSVFFSTKTNNKYLMDEYKGQLLNVHPLLEYFFNLNKKGINPFEWIKSIPLKTEKVKVKNYGVFPLSEVYYQFNKFVFLSNNNFFKKKEQSKILSKKLNPKVVNNNLEDLSQVVFEVTDSCNLDCFYCGCGELYNMFDKREEKKIDLKNAKILLDYLANIWNSSNQTTEKTTSIAFYGGEPLLNVHFIKEVVKYVKQLQVKNRKFTFKMTTNGVLIHKHLNFLTSNDFSLTISLDGDNTNNSYRVFKNKEKSFEKVYNNVVLLKDKYPEYFEKQISFNAVLHNRNSESEIKEYFKTHFGKSPKILPLIRTGIAKNKKDEFFKTFRNKNANLESEEDYNSADKNKLLNHPDYASVQEVIQTYFKLAYKDYSELFREEEPLQLEPTKTCSPFTKHLYMTVNNKISICESLPHNKAMGKIENGQVIINSIDIADKYNSSYEKVKKLCSTCYAYRTCKQCVFIIENLENKPKCHGYQNINDFRSFLGSRVSFIEEEPANYFDMV